MNRLDANADPLSFLSDKSSASVEVNSPSVMDDFRTKSFLTYMSSNGKKKSTRKGHTSEKGTLTSGQSGIFQSS